MYKRSACVDCGACVEVCPVGIHSISKVTGEHEVNQEIECIGCRKCEEACAYGALSISGEGEQSQKLVKSLKKTERFMILRGGGVTVGGGDP